MGLELKGKVSLDGSGFEAGLKALEHAGEKAFEHLKEMAVEAFGIYAIEESVKKTVEYAEKLVDTSRRLGVGIETLQEFSFAARQNGADIDALTGFIEKLNSARIDPKKWGSFAKLGISQSDLESQGVENLIMKLSENIRNRSSQEVIGPLRNIGGKGAGEMLEMLKENMEEVRKEAHDLGQVMSTEDAVQLKFVADEMKILGTVITVSLAPALVFLLDTIMKIVNRLKANGTFWGDFSAGAQQPLDENWKAAKDFFNGKISYREWREIANKNAKAVSQAYDHAGAASENELTAADAAWEEKKAALVARQREIEGLNAHPDFPSVMEPTEKKSKQSLYTDALVGVGNFLGANRGLVTNIAEQQLVVARQHLSVSKQIEQHTKKLSEHAGGTHRSAVWSEMENTVLFPPT